MKKDIAADGAKYAEFVHELKERITSARISAARSVNKELIMLYWDIGQAIVAKQKEHGWGESVVERLSKDLQLEFPSIRGFSPRNLWDMKRFYETYADAPANLRQLVADLATGITQVFYSIIKGSHLRGNV